jgi:hypothetical protein
MNVKEGLYTEFFENGNIKLQGNYKNDRREGIWLIYGTPILELIYKNNMITHTLPLIKYTMPPTPTIIPGQISDFRFPNLIIPLPQIFFPGYITDYKYPDISVPLENLPLPPPRRFQPILK